MIDTYNDDNVLTEPYVTTKEDETLYFPLLSDHASPSRSSLTTIETSSTANSKSLYESAKEENQKLFDRLREENAKLPPQDSTAFILALIERQNILLERDPKSIYIHSNKLKANFSTVQNLVHGNVDGVEEEIDWGFWEAVIEDSDQVALKLPHLLSLKLKSGIPSKVRGLMWQAMSKSASLHLETVYKQLCNERSPHERIIQRDLSRTFPRIDMFKQEDGQGQNSLKHILEAYSLYDTEVGYCQGLAFLVGPLLMNMPEEQSFCVFVRLMETYEMRTMFTLNMEGLQVRLYQFHSLLKEILPDVANHFDNLNVHPAMYASQWFLTLFAYAFPMSLVERIYDIIFAEGAAETIMRVSIAMLKRSQQILLNEVPAEFEHILDFVTSQRVCDLYANDYSQVIHDAMGLSGIITREKMNMLGNEYSLKVDDEQVIIAPRRFSFWKRKRQPELSRHNKYLNNTHASTSNTLKPKPQEPKVRQASFFKKRWSSASSAKDLPFVQKGIPSEKNSEAESLEDKLKQTLCELESLRTKHQQILTELNEARCDNEDLVCERDALKLTITELERCRQMSFRCNDSVVFSATSFSNLEVANNDSALQINQNQTKDECTFADIEDSRSLRSHMIYGEEEKLALEQQCKKLLEDLNCVRSKLNMTHEAQIALSAELVAVKIQAEETKIENANTITENLQLKHKLAQAEGANVWLKEDGEITAYRRHSTTSLLPSATNAQRLYQLETSLKASGLRITEYESYHSNSKKKLTIYDRVLHAFARST
ncbi:rab-GTPase-TBC domain-containing protein [Blakeslea trispora]|nr:rab-GTPase-TBC domain-containing protein [Blakeslea trispora]